jgi:hypothetical protein
VWLDLWKFENESQEISSDNIEKDTFSWIEDLQRIILQ